MSQEWLISMHLVNCWITSHIARFKVYTVFNLSSCVKLFYLQKEVKLSNQTEALPLPVSSVSLEEALHFQSQKKEAKLNYRRLCRKSDSKLRTEL